MSNLEKHNFYYQIVDLLQSARQKVVRSINQTMVITYFEIGRKIVEEEQNGKERADYGKSLLKELSKVLTEEFGRGFSIRNIEQMRKFYLVYSKTQTLSAKSNLAIEKQQTLSVNFELSWSHYLTLMRIDNKNERRFYEGFFLMDEVFFYSCIITVQNG
jgi:hypothetical protein